MLDRAERAQRGLEHAEGDRDLARQGAARRGSGLRPALRLVTALDGGGFRVAGALSIRDWNERFGFTVVPSGFCIP